MDKAIEAAWLESGMCPVKTVTIEELKEMFPDKDEPQTSGGDDV